MNSYFYPEIDAERMDKNEFLKFLKESPKPNRDGIKSGLIDDSGWQIVQQEFVRFEDMSDPPTTCGNLFNYSSRIAVYDIFEDTSPPIPCPPGMKTCATTVVRKRYIGPQISRLSYISLPFKRQTD